MWKVMAESHQIQKQTLDEAKILLAGTPSKLHAKRHSSMSVIDPHKLARSAANLETELRNWRACFESWITSQRSYMHALTGWLLRCMRCEADMSKLPFSPTRSSGTLPIFGLCIQWSKFLDGIQEMPVLDGLDFFAAGMGSLYAQQQREDSRRTPVGSKRFTTGFSPISIAVTSSVITRRIVRAMAGGERSVSTLAATPNTQSGDKSLTSRAQKTSDWLHDSRCN